VSIRTRLEKLETIAGCGMAGSCPECNPFLVAIVEYDLDAPPPPAPATCPRCGQPTAGKVAAILIPRREEKKCG
jgi:hypothetical protein